MDNNNLKVCGNCDHRYTDYRLSSKLGKSVEGCTLKRNENIGSYEVCSRWKYDGVDYFNRLNISERKRGVVQEGFKS